MNTRRLTGDMASQVEADRDELIELRSRITTLLAVIEQCREVIEYAGCHDHTEDIPKFNRPCQLCVKVDYALAAIKKVKSQ